MAHGPISYALGDLMHPSAVLAPAKLFHLGTLVELGPTTDIFTYPREERTKDYITGRYG